MHLTLRFHGSNVTVTSSKSKLAVVFSSTKMSKSFYKQTNSVKMFLVACANSNRSNMHLISKLSINLNIMICTVELQWLEHLWNDENMFETGVVRVNEC